MIYGSVCSGIEAASVAWHPLGWRAAFFSEIEAFPRAVLKERWPGVPIHGDFTTIKEGDYEPIELLVAGTPCQDFSVAGLRAGLAGDRGQLTIEFVRLLERLRPRWMVWENVPGVLSSDDGRAFGLFLGALGECGYGTAWRVLDAQYFGVPQRRRRVFVVGYLGDWRPAAAVLFEPESLRGDSAPRRQAGQNAPTLPSRSTAGGGLGTDFDCDGGLIVGTLGANGKSAANAAGQDAARGMLIAGHFEQNSMGGRGTLGWNDGDRPLGGVPAVMTLAIRGRGDSHDLEYRDGGIANAILTPNGGRAGIGVGAVAVPILEAGARTGKSTTDPRAGIGIGQPGDPQFTLQAGKQHAVAFHQNTRSEVRTSEVAGALSSGGGKPGQGYPAIAFDPTARQPEWSLDRPLKTDGPPAVQSGMSVRRLLPVKCERLMGLPDDYTLVTYRGKPAADGPRYRALGNSMAVPCMRWLGERIQLVTDTMIMMELSDAAE